MRCKRMPPYHDQQQQGASINYVDKQGGRGGGYIQMSMILHNLIVCSKLFSDAGILRGVKIFNVVYGCPPSIRLLYVKWDFSLRCRLSQVKSFILRKVHTKTKTLRESSEPIYRLNGLMMTMIRFFLPCVRVRVVIKVALFLGLPISFQRGVHP